jgi:hypothetical protein
MINAGGEEDGSFPRRLLGLKASLKHNANGSTKAARISFLLTEQPAILQTE